MFVRRLLKNRREVAANKNIDVHAEKNDNNVMMMTNQGHTIERPNESVCI
jgi:hypothetical protein